MGSLNTPSDIQTQSDPSLPVLQGEAREESPRPQETEGMVDSQLALIRSRN